MKTREALGKNGSLILTEMSKRDKKIFTIREAQDIIPLDKKALRETLHYIEKQGWVIRLERGLYLIVPFEAGKEGKWTEDPLILGSKLISPYCISYWTAASHWGWTEQIMKTVFITSPSHKFKNEKVIFGTSFRFIKVKREKFFGLTSEWISNKKIFFSDKEKTIVDMLDNPAYSGGIKEVAKSLKNAFEEKIALEKLTNYANKMGNKSIFKRLGYLAEVLNIFDKAWHKRWNDSISDGYVLLDPSVKKIKKEYNSRWKLVLNISDKELKKGIEE